MREITRRTIGEAVELLFNEPFMRAYKAYIVLLTVSGSLRVMVIDDTQTSPVGRIGMNCWGG